MARVGLSALSVFAFEDYNSFEKKKNVATNKRKLVDMTRAGFFSNTQFRECQHATILVVQQDGGAR